MDGIAELYLVIKCLIKHVVPFETKLSADPILIFDVNLITTLTLFPWALNKTFVTLGNDPGCLRVVIGW